MTNLVDFAKQQIQRAFSNTQYPGDDNLVSNNTSKQPEYLEIKQIFSRTRWQEIRLEDVYKGDTYLTFFSQAAYRYYLPAFMIIALDYYMDKQADNVCLYTLCSLLPDKKKHGMGIKERWLIKYVHGFTEAQKQAIKLFLETLRDVYGDGMAKDALDEFWNDPC